MPDFRVRGQQVPGPLQNARRGFVSQLHIRHELTAVTIARLMIVPTTSFATISCVRLGDLNNDVSQ
jgi:hypothetical protein